MPLGIGWRMTMERTLVWMPLTVRRSSRMSSMRTIGVGRTVRRRRMLRKTLLLAMRNIKAWEM